MVTNSTTADWLLLLLGFENLPDQVLHLGSIIDWTHLSHWHVLFDLIRIA